MAVVGRVSRLEELVAPRLERTFARHGLQDGLFDVAATLRRTGAPYELAPSRLAASTMRTSGATTKRIDRLVAAGLAERRPDPGDGRGVLVRLTAEGLERIDAALEDHVATEAALLEGLDSAERGRLADLLRRLLLTLEA